MVEGIPQFPGMFYNRRGEEINIVEFGRLMEDLAYRVVEKDFRGRYEISTVWLGNNHALGAPDPLIFETMVFDRAREGCDAWADVVCERYSTEEQAREGHRRIARQFGVRSKLRWGWVLLLLAILLTLLWIGGQL